MDLKKSNEYFDKSDVEANKVAAVLAYLGILVVVTLIIAPDSKFARYHANQGVCLLIGEVAFWVVSTIIKVIFGFIPIIGPIIIALFSLIGLVFFVLAIIGMINAAKGEVKELPILGQFQLVK